MHDSQLEDRLRTVLRAEGDGLPMTITAAELERRLAIRRRQDRGRRLTAIAAVIAFMAVGTVAAMANGWLRLPAVGGPTATPLTLSPAPSSSAPSIAPTASPLPSPTPRVAEPVGEVGQAVLVTPIGDNPERPDGFEVTRYDPRTEQTVVLATIPGSVLPADGWLDGDGPPQISATGFLAIPFTRGPNADDIRPSIAIIDTQAPDAAPRILDGYKTMSWDQADKLVVERDNVVWVDWSDGYLQSIFMLGVLGRVETNGGGLGHGPAVSTQDGAQFLATSDGDPRVWGYLTFDHKFIATNDLPPVYQRSGIERPAGAGAHGLGPACDGGGDPGSSGCYLIETDANEKPVTTWLDFNVDPTLYDFVWGANGTSVWMLLEGRPRAGSETASLAYAGSAGAQLARVRVDFADASQARILGIADEPTAGAATVVAIGDDEGRIHAFVLDDGTVRTQDGSSWFAGWAGDPTPYDPD